MGIVAGLVVVVVTGALVVGAVMWRKESSGRERGCSEFSCPSAVFQAQVEVCPGLFVGRADRTHVLVHRAAHGSIHRSKAQVRVKDRLITPVNVVTDSIPSSHRSESEVRAEDRLQEDGWSRPAISFLPVPDPALGLQ